MASVPFRYQSPDEDSARWLGFAYRDGDIVISTRRSEPNVRLAHYDDLQADLEGQMHRLAGQLGITVPADAWPALVRAATFEGMRGSADRLVPTAGVFKSNAAFFRRGTSGAAREILTDEESAGYHARAARLAPPDMLAWLHREP